MSNPHKDWLVQEQTALGKDISNPLWLAICPKLYGSSTPHHPQKIMSWLAHKVMACGKGRGKTIIGNQLTKDNINNLSKSWLVLSKRLQVKTNQNR